MQGNSVGDLVGIDGRIQCQQVPVHFEKGNRVENHNDPDNLSHKQKDHPNPHPECEVRSTGQRDPAPDGDTQEGKQKRDEQGTHRDHDAQIKRSHRIEVRGNPTPLLQRDEADLGDSCEAKGPGQEPAFPRCAGKEAE